MSAAILSHSNGALWRSDKNGGYNGFGTVTGEMWRSDGNGGFNGLALELMAKCGAPTGRVVSTVLDPVSKAR